MSNNHPYHTLTPPFFSSTMTLRFANLCWISPRPYSPLCSQILMAILKEGFQHQTYRVYCSDPVAEVVSTRSARHSPPLAPFAFCVLQLRYGSAQLLNRFHGDCTISTTGCVLEYFLSSVRFLFID